MLCYGSSEILEWIDDHDIRKKYTQRDPRGRMTYDGSQFDKCHQTELWQCKTAEAETLEIFQVREN